MNDDHDQMYAEMDYLLGRARASGAEYEQIANFIVGCPNGQELLIESAKYLGIDPAQDMTAIPIGCGLLFPLAIAFLAGVQCGSNKASACDKSQ